MHAVNSGLAALRHLWISKRGHPEQLFMEMSRLGGALCTFALESHPRTLPIYDHRNLSECFEKLDEHIRTHLETIVPTNCVEIPLTKMADYFYEGDVNDSRMLGRARWVLGVHAKLGEAELIERVPQLVKLCSAKFVANWSSAPWRGWPSLTCRFHRRLFRPASRRITSACRAMAPSGITSFKPAGSASTFQAK